MYNNDFNSFDEAIEFISNEKETIVYIGEPSYHTTYGEKYMSINITRIIDDKINHTRVKDISCIRVFYKRKETDKMKKSPLYFNEKFKELRMKEVIKENRLNILDSIFSHNMGKEIMQFYEDSIEDLFESQYDINRVLSCMTDELIRRSTKCPICGKHREYDERFHAIIGFSDYGCLCDVDIYDITISCNKCYDNIYNKNIVNDSNEFHAIKSLLKYGDKEKLKALNELAKFLKD